MPRCERFEVNGAQVRHRRQGGSSLNGGESEAQDMRWSIRRGGGRPGVKLYPVRKIFANNC